jgi:RND family efflux transporter MFP subunit
LGWLLVALLLAAAPVAAQSPIEGFTEPYRRSELASTEPGVVASVLVDEGDRVEAGQLVAQLENSALKAAAAAAQETAASLGRLDAAKAECELRERRLNRLKELRAKGHAHLEEVDRAETDLDVAQANLRIAQEQQRVDVLQSKHADALLERRNVRSTLDGLVVLIHHQPGEFVTTASPAVVTVVQIDKLRVIFAIPTGEARRLASGQRVQVRFAETDSVATAVVESVSPVTDPESGTVRVRVLIDNSQELHPCGVKCELIMPARVACLDAKK